MCDIISTHILLQFLLQNSPRRMATVQDIYDYIMKTFLYYGQLKKNKRWQKTVRINLSVHKLFVRSELIPGKPITWTLDPEYDSNMKDLLHGFLKTSGTLFKEDSTPEDTALVWQLTHFLFLFPFLYKHHSEILRNTCSLPFLPATPSIGLGPLKGFLS